MSFQNNLDKILNRVQELSESLSSGIIGDEFVKASKSYSELEPVAEKIKEYRKALSDLTGAEEMLKEDDLDSETKEMVEEEIRALNTAINQLEREVKLALLPKDEADSKGAIIEIRAGTGGGRSGLVCS